MPGSMKRFYWLMVSVFMSGSLVHSEEAPVSRLATFEGEVEPVLKRVCVGCHGPEKQKGKFRVDTLDPDLVKGEIRVS